jgi:hypothetical protein
VDARFGPFRDSANLDTRKVHGFPLNIPKAQKLFWTRPIEHLDDVGHVGSHFGPFRVSVSIEARWLHGMRQAYRNLRNRFERTLWFS